MQLVAMSREDIVARVNVECPHARDAVAVARAVVPYLKRQIDEFQASALFALAAPFDSKGSHILEIGTAWGFSAAVLALACPEASITTLNPKPTEVPYARRNLERFPNVSVLAECSWDYLSRYEGPEMDMVFVDGDHSAEAVRKDMAWYNWLRPSGLMLFHDYAPKGSARPCPPVKDACDDMAAKLRRNFDVMVVDDQQVGMVGFYRREGESYGA